MFSRSSTFGRCATILAVAALMPVTVADAASRDKRFFESVAGVWKGPGEIVAGKYKGTKFTCNLTGLPAEGKETGLKLDGTCRVGVFSQPMKATIAEVGGKYQGQFLDGADGKGLDIVSGAVTGDTYRVTGTYTASGSGTVTNAGLFDAATITAGNLFMYGDFTGIGLAANDAIAFTIDVVFG